MALERRKKTRQLIAIIEMGNEEILASTKVGDQHFIVNTKKGLAPHRIDLAKALSLYRKHKALGAIIHNKPLNEVVTSYTKDEEEPGMSLTELVAQSKRTRDAIWAEVNERKQKRKGNDSTND